MKIYLRELSEQETELDFNQESPWVVAAVERVDETTEEDESAKNQLAALRPKSTQPKTPPAARPVEAHFSLRLVDEVAVLNGSIRSHVVLLCSRCGSPFRLHVSNTFTGLYSKDPDMAGVGHLIGARPAGQNKGHARHAHDENAADASNDLDITYLPHEYIDLGEVLTEHLQLQLPFQPLCDENCKGVCTQCGTDLNRGRCACAKIQSTSPFAVLKQKKSDPH
jgi:uncharacterized protein